MLNLEERKNQMERYKLALTTDGIFPLGDLCELAWELSSTVPAGVEPREGLLRVLLPKQQALKNESTVGSVLVIVSE